MHDLTVVGLSADGERLVLVSSDGEEFAVVVDDRLRQSLRPFPTRPPAAPVAPGRTPRRDRQLETTMDSVLRPRDIQARIRAGESPETVAEAARTTVDGIMAFAGPVLAERQHVAQLAQKASVRRRSTEAGGARVLGEAAETFLAAHGLHDDDLEWDAWRRPDGRWALVATFAVDGRPARAEFVHDLPGRFVVAENDDARVLTGEHTAGAPDAATSPASRRLSSVRFGGEEVPLGDDAIELVRDPARTTPSPQAPEDDAAHAGDPAQAVDAGDPDEPDEPGGDTETVAPGDTSVPGDPGAPDDTAAPHDMDPLPFDPAADTADADWLVAVDAPAAPAGPATEHDAHLDDQPDDRPAARSATTEPAATSAPAPVEDEQEVLPGTETEPVEPPAQPAPAPSRRKARSSVPSWDEIMFGGGKGD
ncbi:septation protein SepH [Nocardioides korecus]